MKVRGVLSLLTYSRSIEPTKSELKDKKEVNLDSIIDPQRGKGYMIPKSFVDAFVTKFNLKLSTPTYDKTKLYISTKGSPFGASVVGAPLAITSIAKNYPDLLDKFRDIMGSESFEDLINRNINLYQSHPDLLPDICPNLEINEEEFGKLGIVRDPEMKIRVIAMLDYYSQFILRPIHDDLLRCLRKFSCDRTFTQDPFHVWNVNRDKY